MNKGVVIGGVVGLLVVAGLGGYLLTHSPVDTAPVGAGTPAPQTSITQPAGTTDSNLPAATADTPLTGGMPSGNASGADTSLAPANPSLGTAGQTGDANTNATPMSRAERRAIRSAVNERMKALTAKGDKLTIAQIQAEMDQIEAMGKGMYDKVYFDGMREILTQIAEIQALNKQLATLKDEKGQSADQQRLALLAQIKERSAAMGTASAKLQQYALDQVKQSQGGAQ